ncbi:DUF305 domain-containing protein [Sphingomonas sp. LHG3406-1]|uniref:DUF305 domain-containing protein n=1 Tax=Sphingomonas sp. LHG3406-1 TaxID=2804617 RepID=UPI00261060CB|nr:DUF305 domain-containing protein [Sphingomonas sp. LHG3406-1]
MRDQVTMTLRGVKLLLLSAGCTASLAAAQSAPIVQPGAPGQASRVIDATTASRIADTSFSAYDVSFLQDMIPHHGQATVMTAMVPGRTARPEIVQMAKRIDASQGDEISWMKKWLADRAQPVEGPHAAHMMQDAAHMTHMGMATPAQLQEMSAAKGIAFERLFLTRMITHHQGAIRMARELLQRGGTAADPALNTFIADLIKEQQEEIKRMSALLGTIAEDPRTALKAGTNDAGQAIRGLALVASLPKPTGFFDPANPYDLPASALVKKGEKAPAGAGRSPLLSFAQTDMAFQGDVLATGNYHGFSIYRVSPTGAAPTLVSSTICPGGQGDLSIVGNLLIMSVEQNRGRLDCGRQGIQQDASPERFRGIRIFDISNLAAPRQVGAVQTCRGSHTHSVVSGPGRDGKIIVYVSGTANVRSAKEDANCVSDPGSMKSALFSIDVIEIPVANPAAARIVDRPRVFGDPATGSISGLWAGGDHGDGTQDTAQTDQCHDITVFPSLKLAAGACSGNGILLDISTPAKPRRIDQVLDPTFAYWHSATFNNDGTKVLFTDEWGGGGRPRCLVSDPRNWGANAIYDIEGGRLRFRNHYKLPAAQSEQENCVAHNGSIIPVPGRDLFVQAWYQGGISISDFTDSSRPAEIAYFDRGPVYKDELVMGGFWSAYYYKGRIYGTEIARGLDVLALQPGPQLTANEIAAAALAQHPNDRFNPQQQAPVSWPAVPVVALAYVDQLERSQSLPAAQIASLRTALASPQPAQLRSLAAGLRAPADPVAAKRVAALKQVLAQIGG